jgi:adenylate cyclase
LTHLSDVVGAVRGSIILPGQPNQADGSQPQFYSTSRKPMLLPLADLLRHGVAGWVLREREPLVIADTHHDERWIGNDLHQRSIHSVAAAPILNERDVLGVITLVHHTPNYFQNEHLELLRSVAAQSATALEKAQLFRVVNEQNDLLEQLFRRAEEERSTLNAVLRSAADPILMIGPQEEVLLANPAAETRLLLDAPEQRQGRRLRELLPPTVRHHLFGAEGQEPLAQSRSNEVVLPDASTLVVSVAPVRAVDGQLLGQVATFQDITAIKELERQRFEQMQGVLRRYVSPSVVDELLKRGADAFGSPEERDVAVLFADLRGYTALAEGLDPHVLVEQVLNRYFRAMTEVLYSYDGTIDKFLGDGVIGAFGTPLARHDDIQRALHAVVDMQRAFARLQGLWRAELDLDIGMGIGLSYGRAVVGNIGSDQHLDYTLVGDVVNTASRLSSIAAPGQIIVSHQLIERLPPHWSAPWPLRCLPPVRLKNKRDPHLVYQIEYTADAAVLDRS